LRAARGAFFPNGHSRASTRDLVCRADCDGVAFGTAGTLKAHISAIHLKIKRSRGAK
jgi:hypothetical protein